MIKKQKAIKFSAAAALALSALTPVAVFANEDTTTTETAAVANGYYSNAGSVLFSELEGLTKAEMKAKLKAFLKESAKVGGPVLLVSGEKVYDVNSDAVKNATSEEEFVKAGTEVEKYQEETGTILTEEGIVGGDETPEENSIETFFYNLAA